MKIATAVAALLAATPLFAYDTVHFQEAVDVSSAKRPAAAAATQDRLYVLDDKDGKLLIFSLPDGKRVKAVDVGLRSPKGLAAAQGKLYVADTGNDRVVVFDADGKTLSSFGSRGSQAGELKEPESVAVGRDGRVYVADTGNDRVEVFTGDGILLSQLGSEGKEPGQFRKPTKVAVDPSDQLYVLDSGNERVEIFGADARFSRELPISGQDFVVDDYGYLYELEAGEGRVVEHAPGGAVLGRFGSRGAGAGQFKKPQGLALAPDGRLAVLDEGKRSVQLIEVANKDKVTPLALDTRTRMFASGPSKLFNLAAGPIAARGGELYAYLPGDGAFVVLDEDGKELRRFGTKQGKAPFVTKGAAGFAVSKLGLYVSDGPGNRIQRFTLDGVWKADYAESQGFFDSRKKEGRVRDPRGVAVNEQGTVYVADAGNRRIDAFSPDGVYLFGIGPTVGDNELQEPVSAAWDAKGRHLYFVDRGLKKVFEVEPSGALVKTWGRPGTGPGEFGSPEAVVYDGQNYLYVLDRQLKRVSVFDKDGAWLTDLFSGGADERGLGDPVALAIWGSRLLVSDRGRRRVAAFDLHPSLAAPTAISTQSKEGVVSLSWQAVDDPWTKGYRVWRASEPAGPFELAADVEQPRLDDEHVKPYERYWYRFATQAKTGDVGAVSQPVEVLVAGEFNKPPIELSTVTIGDVFPANYKWYLKNPAGQAVVTNNVNVAFHNVKVTFRLKDFMDFGYDTVIKKLEPGQSVEVPLIATLNNRILDVTEETPIQAELSLTYFERGQPQSVSLTKPLIVHSRNAITWQDPQRVANFITPNDTPVFDFARAALHDAPGGPHDASLPDEVQKAVHVWDALSEEGVRFSANPTNPFETLSADPNFPVDYAQFPRETLRRKSGQCDDLTTLMISLLDSQNVRAAVVDYPGHMGLMFDTGESDEASTGLSPDVLVQHEGDWWVPVEPTLVGKSFDEAAIKGAYMYKTELAKNDVRVIEVRKAWKTFEPVTMPSTDWRAEAPAADALAKRYAAETDALFSAGYEALKARYEAALKAAPDDADSRLRLGYLEFQAGNKDAAVDQFQAILKSNPANAAALNDLGNIDFLAGDYQQAAGQYLKAAQLQPDDADLWLNLVKAQVHLKAKDLAAEYGKKAVAADPNTAPAVETLIKSLE